MRRACTLLAIALAASVVSTPPAHATPEHDAFSNARQITLDDRITDDSSGATLEAGEPEPTCGTLGATLWYRLDLEFSRTLVVDTFGSKYDTVLGIYRGENVKDLEEIACSDDDTSVGSMQSRVRFSTQPGTVYLQVGGYEGASGHIQINIDVPVPDAFAEALPITDLPFTDDRDTTTATTESNEPWCFGMENTIWYELRPTEDMPIVVSTVDSDFDTVLAIYEGESIDRLDRIACEDDTHGPQAEVAFEAAANRTYMIQAGGRSGGGLLHLSVDAIETPENDDLASATPVGHVPFDLETWNYRASVEPGEPRRCGGAGATIWFSFVPGDDEGYVVSTYGSGFDSVVAVYRGTEFANLEQIACSDDVGHERNGIVGFSVEAGETYYIQVGGFLSETGPARITLDRGMWISASGSVAGRVDAGVQGNRVGVCLTSRFAPSFCAFL